MSPERRKPDFFDVSIEPEHLKEPNPLKTTVSFLAIPAILLVLVLGTNIAIPKIIMYAIALVMGMTIALKSLRNPELLLAVVILYLPISKMIVVPVAPGINGTNMLILLLLISWLSISRLYNESTFRLLPNTRLMLFYAVVSSISAITLIFKMDNGLSYLLEDVIEEYKGWLDQFFIFFPFLFLIRNRDMAKRLVIYMMLGYLVVVVLGVKETLERMGYDSIEKSRVLGPQLQPNDFGAFLVYGLPPFMAIFIMKFHNWRSWPLVPFFAVVAKVLLSTFSRGAYLGMGIAGLVAGYVRGKWFFFFGSILGLTILVTMPHLIPESLIDRINQTQTDEPGRMDASSEGRLILWDAAIAMTLEDPLLGKGFKSFQVLKGGYTEYDVRETDTHNMYLFISSQMGIPAMVALVWLIYRMYAMGKGLFRNLKEDETTRMIGLAGAAMAAGLFTINMFGSRMVNVEVCGYFWIMLAVISYLVANPLNSPDSPSTNPSTDEHEPEQQTDNHSYY